MNNQQQQQSRHALFITHVDKEGPFLKISAQFDRKTSTFIEQVLLNAQQQFNNGLYVPSPATLQSGMLCSVKYRDNKYYRCCIMNLNYLKNHYVEVNFIDYGFYDLVPLNHLRSLENFENSFTSIPPQAISYLLAEAVCARGEWNDMILAQLAEEIRFTEVTCNIVAQIADYYLARFFHGQLDLTISLITRGLMRHTSLQTQEAVLLSMLPNRRKSYQTPIAIATTPTPTTVAAASTVPTSPTTATQNIVTYKAFTLEPGQQYPVYVSYVQDGPCNFSVQLQQSEEALCKLMKEINSMPLTPLDGIPIPGTVCLARCTEDGHICRAVVTNEVDGNFKVFYVDFGNFEIVSLDALYEIPFKCVIPKVMAIRFSLAGIEKQSVTLEMQCAFKEFVDNRLICMKVLPMTTRTSLPKCELWDPVTKVNALDVINEAAAVSYPEQIQLNRGYTQLVKVCYVYSCNRLYVQLKNKENELNNLMNDIQTICQNNNTQLTGEQIKIGLPCYALYENDQQWYRSQIIDITDNDRVIVHYVDYGNDETIERTLLKPIDGKQLVRLYPQAIECCLNGYQKMDIDIERDHLLEELILEKEFTMKVVDMYNNRALIELIDTSNYNVASLLLERIAQSKSKISPLLVHADYKIEHRKSQQQNQSQQHRLQRKTTDDSGGEQTQQSTWENSGKRDSFNDNRTSGNWRSPVSDNKSKQFDMNRQTKRDRYNSSNNNDRNDDQQSNDENWRPNNRSNNRVTNKRNLNSSNDSDSSVQSRLRNRDKFDNKPNRNNDNNWNNDDSYRDKKNSFSSSFRETTKGRDSRKNRDNFNTRRENAEIMSSSGSEKSFRKNKPNNRYDNTKNQRNHRSGGSNFKKFDKSPSPIHINNFNNNYNNSNNDNNSVLSPKAILKDIATENDQYKIQEFEQEESNIIISWFHNPNNFYCQLLCKQEEFKKLMEDIQETYKDLKNSKIEQQEIGAPIIGLFPEDGVLYRGKIIDKCGYNQYKIYYIDFGNVSIIEQVWPIEKRFMELPAQAIQCSLFNIDSVNENWFDTSQYSPYFNRKQFRCKNLFKKNNKNVIELFYEDENIAQSLIRDGLVKLRSTPIDLNLLTNQRFRAKIIKINNLDDFTIITREFEKILNCSIYNNADTSIDQNILFDNLGKTCIVVVNRVNNDRLEVTVYSNNGEKLSPNDDGDGKIDPIMPYFLTQTKISGYIIHIDHDTNLNYVQLYESDDHLKELLQNLYEYYQNTIDNTVDIEPVLNKIYAVLSPDTNWYRGRLIQINNDDNTVLVNYIDYGNSEIVPLTNLRELIMDYIEPHTYCVPVRMSIPTDDLLEQNLDLELKLVETCDYYDARIVTEEDVAVAAVEPEQVLQQHEQPINEVIKEENNDSIFVLISHIDSPNDFYIQLQKSCDDIDKLQQQLQNEIDKMPDLENPTIGVLCAAPYSLDQQWYRAQVLDADSDITTVRFIDYGNTDVISNQTNKIKQLPTNLLQLAVYATRCCLNIQPINETEWNTETIKYFEDLTTTQNHMICKFLQQDEKINYVELYDDEKRNITELLINENLAKPHEFLSEKTINNNNIGFVSHFNSPSEFWIQLENCIDELEWIAEQLSTAEQFAELQDLSPGILCAALFPDDQMWYRARILSNTIAGIEVLFIDYGNSCSITTDSLRELPEDLLMLPPQAQKCCLRKPDGLLNWSPEMCNRFYNISADGQAMFTVKKISTGETSLVELLLNGEDITKMLLPITEPVRVKNFTNFDDLLLIKCNDNIEIDKKFKLKPLPDVEWNDESIEKFIKISNNGTTVFQAEFYEDDDGDFVVLYLDLNDIRIDLNGIRKSTVTSPMKIRIEQGDNHEINVDNVLDEKPEDSQEIAEMTDIINGQDIVEGNSQKEIRIESNVDNIQEIVEERSEKETEIELNVDKSQGIVEENSGKEIEIESNVDNTQEIREESEKDIGIDSIVSESQEIVKENSGKDIESNVDNTQQIVQEEESEKEIESNVDQNMEIVEENSGKEIELNVDNTQKIVEQFEKETEIKSNTGNSREILEHNSEKETKIESNIENNQEILEQNSEEETKIESYIHDTQVIVEKNFKKETKIDANTQDTQKIVENAVTHDSGCEEIKTEKLEANITEKESKNNITTETTEIESKTEKLDDTTETFETVVEQNRSEKIAENDKNTVVTSGKNVQNTEKYVDNKTIELSETVEIKGSDRNDDDVKNENTDKTSDSNSCDKPKQQLE